PPGGAVADLEEIVRMGEDERPVVQVEHVELDEVAAELHRAPDRPQRVLRLQRGGALVADSKRSAVGPEPHRRRTTTIAQSSRSSPPANRLRSSSAVSASTWAGAS